MQFVRTTCEWSQFSTNILHTDSSRSEVVSKIKTIRWPEQCTFLDFRNFAMHTFTNRCSSASNSLIKFRRSPYFSFRVGLCYKSPGPDGIHPRILDETRSIIAAPLKKIFETSLLLKELPYDWRTANISAIHKNGNKSEVFSELCKSVWLVLSANSWKKKLEITY